MGKEGGERQRQSPEDGGGGGGGGGGRSRGSVCCGRGAVRPQCVAALMLGAAVMLSAVFWLPPFAGHRGGAGPPDPGAEFSADIVASFRLQKTVSELTESTTKLELDIYEEIGIPNSTVAVNSLQPFTGSNWTNVIFSIVPYPKNSTTSSTWLSILRSSFMSLVVQESTLHLTESLFGNSSFFEVLKFPGGITIIPPQSAFLLQKPHASFNFTLNFPIYKVKQKVGELKDQMKMGLLLNSYENLYIKLTNLQGSTIARPTVVQTSIVLKVGNHQPSLPRMKQLAQTITNSSSGNLGLNHTVFGRVKQISLSSYLRHSLHGRGSSDAPSPAPMAHQDRRCRHHHHQHHHHHHHHGHEGRHLAPSPAPVNFPVQQPRYKSPPPSGCQYGYSNKPKSKAPVAPAAEPVASNHHYASATSPHAMSPSAHHSPHNPSIQNTPPVPSPPVLPKPPTAWFTHPNPPSESATSPVAPVPHSSYATQRHSCCWFLVPLLCILMDLL